MKYSAWILTLLLVAGSAPAAFAEDTTLKGDYRWDRGTKGPLEAVFTPDGEGVWKVAFHFKHRSRPHTYKGTATGSLTAGDIRGTVKTKGRDRTFSFECTYKNGTCRGTHYEVFGERKSKTGTLSLEAPQSAQVAVR